MRSDQERSTSGHQKRSRGRSRQISPLLEQPDSTRNNAHPGAVSGPGRRFVGAVVAAIARVVLG